MHDLYLIKKSETQDEDFFEYFWRDKDHYTDFIVGYIGLEHKIVDYIHDTGSGKKWITKKSIMKN